MRALGSAASALISFPLQQIWLGDICRDPLSVPTKVRLEGHGSVGIKLVTVSSR
jgi:hypothetical protein